MTKHVVEGGCLCGAIRYHATAAPVNSMICHCHSCRRAAGAPVVAWVTFPMHSFSFTKGTPAHYRSSPEVIRTFCATCGTPLTYIHEKRPDDADVTTCSLDQPERFAPTHHGWMVDTLPWIRFGDGLPANPTVSGAS